MMQFRIVGTGGRLGVCLLHDFGLLGRAEPDLAKAADSFSVAAPKGVGRIYQHSSALSQTDGTGRRSSLARMASADLVQTNGFGLALCSAR